MVRNKEYVLKIISLLMKIEYEELKEFVYLRAIVPSKTEQGKEMHAILNKVNRCRPTVKKLRLTEREHLHQILQHNTEVDSST